MFSNKNCIMKLAKFHHLKVASTTCMRQKSTSTQDGQEKKEKTIDKGAKQSKSFVMNLFLGRSVLEQVSPYPNSMDDDQKETLQMLVGPTEKFFKECNNASLNDSKEVVDPKTVEGLKELGAFGMQVPTEYGGVGLCNVQYGRFGEIMGYNDLGLSIMLGAHQSIGFKGILLAGNPEQKAKYLPKVASGENIAAFALTEPTCGSDAGSVKCRAVPSKDGSHYVLNGSKIWISNGGLAEIYTVFAQTPVYDEKTKAVRDKVTAFIVERSFGGLTHGPPEKKMGIKCSNTTEVFFENVKIPSENVLGGVGNGFKIAMEILNNGRFGMCTAMTGSMRFSIEKAVEFATNRVQFGKKIDTFGAIQEKLARMAMRHYVAESMGIMIASNMDMGSKDFHLEAAISKVFASEAAWTTCDEAIQVMGGMGFMRETGLERVLRDLRIFRIFEGTNDILRLLVALTGLQYAGGHLKELQKALKNPTANLGLLLGEGTKRAIGIFKPSGVPLRGIHGNFLDSRTRVSEAVIKFGACSEALLAKHGKKIVEEQFILNRLADSAIDIYSSVVVLSRASRSLHTGIESAYHEEKLAKVWTDEAMNRVSQNLTAATSSRHLTNYELMAEISQDLCSNGGIVCQRVLGM